MYHVLTYRFHSNRNLHPYYVMENGMLIASTPDDSNEADLWRRAAEESDNTSPLRKRVYNILACRRRSYAMLYHIVALSVITTGLAVQELVVRWTMYF
jgi:hypothetical protein